MNYQRRMFRGRGGPNDRRLPKFNARRRKRQQPTGRPSDDDTRNNMIVDDNVVDDSLGASMSPASDPEIASAPITDLQEEEEGEVNHYRFESEDVEIRESSYESNASISFEKGTNENLLKDSENTKINPCLDEIQHLKRRIRNVQESIQTSVSIVNPTTYQENVLNATQNVVNEWRSIVRHYDGINAEHLAGNSNHNYGEEGITKELRTQTALEVFQLIQLSLQSGPLKGAKPGYFKRCGAETAKVVVIFLDNIIPQHTTLATCMGFSDKQINAMNQWKSNAEKAVANDNPPSKHISKMQQQSQLHQQLSSKKKKVAVKKRK